MNSASVAARQLMFSLFLLMILVLIRRESDAQKALVFSAHYSMNANMKKAKKMIIPRNIALELAKTFPNLFPDALDLICRRYGMTEEFKYSFLQSIGPEKIKIEFERMENGEAPSEEFKNEYDTFKRQREKRGAEQSFSQRQTISEATSEVQKKAYLNQIKKMIGEVFICGIYPDPDFFSGKTSLPSLDPLARNSTKKKAL
jgi:hypothetical protein